MSDTAKELNTNAPSDENGGASGKPPARTTAKSPKNAGKGEKQAAKVARKKLAYMYLGPNLPGGILFTGSVYKELPEHLADVFERLPEMKELFVEIKEVSAFKAELERQGSEPFRIRQNVERLISEGALKNGGV